MIVGFGTIGLLLRKRVQEVAPAEVRPCASVTFVTLPTHWLAIKSESMVAVQAALHVHNPESCSWSEGLSRETPLFISPSIEGWIIVTGDSLPDPSGDVDASFRFLVNLSRKLGEVQYFSASPALHYHAWSKVRAGRVIRAYAWAGETLWNQGAKTREEKELGLRTFDYFDEAQSAFSMNDSAIESNAEKVPRLAARWSLDLVHVREHLQQRGITGTPSGF